MRGFKGGMFGGGFRTGRKFDAADLQLIILALLSEQPRHGYELIKTFEERSGGFYVPSPGVIYPTLAWLDDMGYAAVDADEPGRKRYRVTREGGSFIAANRAAIDEVLARSGHDRVHGRHRDVPAPILRAMENLKLALRLRFRAGPLDKATAERIAAAIDIAAQSVERIE